MKQIKLISVLVSLSLVFILGCQETKKDKDKKNKAKTEMVKQEKQEKQLLRFY